MCMRITEIERHDITVELVDWNADGVMRYHGSPYPRTVPQTGYADPLKTDCLDDDGSKEYRAMFAHCRKGPVWKRDGEGCIL